MTLLLDSSVLIDVLRARANRRGLLTRLVKEGHRLATTSVNIAEIYAGMRQTETEQTEAFLSRLQCFPITRETGRRAGALKNTYARQGITLELPDMLIASTALEHSLTLMTDNRKDFPIPELAMYALT